MAGFSSKWWILQLKVLSSTAHLWAYGPVICCHSKKVTIACSRKTKSNSRTKLGQALQIDSHELNWFQYSLLFFENSRTNPHGIETNWNWTEHRARSTMNWTELHKELVDELSWIIVMSRWRWELNRFWLYLNKFIWKGCHWYRIVNWTMQIREVNWKRVLNWIESITLRKNQNWSEFENQGICNGSELES